MISEGNAFPDFELADQTGAMHTAAELMGKKTVIYFYPKDDTPDCTAEACEFQESLGLPIFTELPNVQIFGVSPDGVKSHKKFADKFGLKFPLLADVDKKLCEALGLWVEKSMYGKKYMGVERTTFVVGENGVIEKVYQKVKPQGHAQEVLQALA